MLDLVQNWALLWIGPLGCKLSLVNPELILGSSSTLVWLARMG